MNAILPDKQLLKRDTLQSIRRHGLSVKHALRQISRTIIHIKHVAFAFEKLKEIYAGAGGEDRCELFIGDGGHRYYKTGAWPFVKRFFSD